MLREGEGSNSVDVVFDVYRHISIKSAERELRGKCDAITFKNLAAGQKQFKKFLHNGDNKTSLIRFVLSSHWQKTLSCERMEDKELYVTYGDRCYTITADRVKKEEELTSKQEEADTRLLLHVQHAANEQRYRSIIVSSEDTDVRILCLVF